MGVEVCLYCGKLPRQHTAWPFGHRPMLFSEILAEEIRKRDAKARATAPPRKSLRERVRAEPSA